MKDVFHTRHDDRRVQEVQEFAHVCGDDFTTVCLVAGLDAGGWRCERYDQEICGFGSRR